MICCPSSHKISYLTLGNSCPFFHLQFKVLFFCEFFAHFAIFHFLTFTYRASWWTISQIKTHSPGLNKDSVNCISALLLGSLLASATGRIGGILESQRRKIGFSPLCFVSSFWFALCLATITTVVSLDFDGDNSLNDSIWFQSPVFNTFLKVKVAQSCPSLCDTGDYTVHGILQARLREWVAFPFSKVSSQPRDRTQVSHAAGEFFTSWATREAQDTGVGTPSLLQQIFQTQESNQGLLHGRQILYQLIYQGGPNTFITTLIVTPWGYQASCSSSPSRSESLLLPLFSWDVYLMCVVPPP